MAFRNQQYHVTSQHNMKKLQQQFNIQLLTILSFILKFKLHMLEKLSIIVVNRKHSVK